MYQKYIVEKLSIKKISELSGHCTSTIHKWLRKLGIPTRKPWTFSKGRQHSEETKQKLSELRKGCKNPFYGKHHTTETREHLRKCSTGRKHTKEELRKMSEALSGKNNPMWGKKHNEESNKKRSEALKGSKNHNYGKKLTEEQKKRIGDFHRGKIISIEQKKKISKALRGKMVGPKNPRWGKTPAPSRGQWYIRKDTDERIWLRSSYEVITADKLTELGIPWQYEPKRFVLKDRTYLPDFYLPTEGVFWEVKGWFNSHAQETIKQFRELYPEIPLVVIDKNIIEGWRKQNTKMAI